MKWCNKNRNSDHHYRTHWNFVLNLFEKIHKGPQQNFWLFSWQLKRFCVERKCTRLFWLWRQRHVFYKTVHLGHASHLDILHRRSDETIELWYRSSRSWPQRWQKKWTKLQRWPTCKLRGKSPRKGRVFQASCSYKPTQRFLYVSLWLWRNIKCYTRVICSVDKKCLFQALWAFKNAKIDKLFAILIFGVFENVLKTQSVRYVAFAHRQ